MKIIIAVALIVFLVFVLIFLFAAMKINGNETSKLEEDIEQKKYIDNMQSKSRHILHPEYLTAARVYNIVCQVCSQTNGCEIGFLEQSETVIVCIVFCTKIEYN